MPDQFPWRPLLVLDDNSFAIKGESAVMVTELSNKEKGSSIEIKK